MLYIRSGAKKLLLSTTIQTPILFLIFNRVELTKKVFAAIRQVQPLRLYIASDGPRSTHQNESFIVQEVRDYVLSHIDWDCEVKTLFREQNLGCKYAVSGAIDWFFESEEMGIVLEDDCLPNHTFFYFCEILLNYYKNDSRIMQVSGSNFFFKETNSASSYYFSKYGPIWGWATWKRAWKLYDVEMTCWPSVKEEKKHYQFCFNKKEVLAREKIFDAVYNKKIDTWDYQWSFAKHLNQGLSITPSCHLVSNIGAGEDATHTKGTLDFRMQLKTLDIEFPLKHPDQVEQNITADFLYFERIIQRDLKTMIKKLVQKICYFLKWKY